MKSKLSAMLMVSHDGKDFSYRYFGDVDNEHGDITVCGPKNKPATVEFTLVAGEGVSSLRFLDDPKASIKVGLEGSACPPIQSNGGEFDDEKHGKSKNVIRIRDKKSTIGGARYPYALHFHAELDSGGEVKTFSDPMFIND